MPKRYLIVPDAQVPDALLVRAAATADSSLQQDGLKVHQPEDRTGELVQGDIRPSLSGTPEEYSKGLITVNKAGVVEDARFGWMRDGDDEDTDLQLRQSPHVCGRLVDMITRSTTDRIVRPKLLSLKSGKLFCMWMQADCQPVQAELVAGGLNGSLLFSILDPDSPTWATPDLGPDPSDPALGGGALVAFDVVQYLDTGELLAFVLVGTAPDNRRLYVYYTLDDGLNWHEKARRHFDGAIPDILLDTDGDGVADATAFGLFAGCAAEIMDSGRIVMLMLTQASTWSLVSDDRGASWSAASLLTHSIPSQIHPGHGVGSTKARNGCAVFIVARRSITDEPVETKVLLTFNGIDWSSEITVNSNLVTTEVSVCNSPDGFLHIYGTFHRAFDPYDLGLTQMDWLWGRRIKTREPNIGMGADDLIPYPPAGRVCMAFHGLKQGGSGNYLTTGIDPPIPQIVYKGFVGIDSVEHRGQTYIATGYQRDTSSGASGMPTLNTSALMCYRVNHWQPLQERLSNAHPSINSWLPDFPMGGRVYNRTWDCYDTPGDAGFTSVGAGTAVVSAGTEDGYMQIVSPASRTFSDAALPAPSASQDGAVRMLVQCISGGSLTSDRVALRFFFSRAGAASCGRIRFERGTDTKVALINWNTGAIIGQTSFPNGRWIEVLVAAREETGLGTFRVTAYARAYDRSGDRDFESPYTELGVATGLTTVAVADGIAWGHFFDTADESWWKTVQIHRTDTTDFCELAPQPSAAADTDENNNMSLGGTGEIVLDSGIDNVMRTSRSSAKPAQFVTDGISATWRGEAITDGQFTFETDYNYAAENVLNAPVREEWRSAHTAKAIELVFDSGWDAGSGVKFRPEAFAAFGRNFPELTVQLNDSDSWGAPSVSRTYGCWGAASTPQRYTHLWAMKISAGWGYYISGFRLTVYQSPGAQTEVSPWRPHQFRTNPVGSRYYCVFRNAGSGVSYIYRIADNTEDTLVFVTAPDLTLVTAGGSPTDFAYDFAIYADCFASRLDHRYSASFTDGVKTYGNTHPVGFRYARLLMPVVTHKDADETFYRLGYALMGQMVELHSPDPQWGFSIETASGHDVSYGQGGVGSARRRSAPRRSWHLDYSYMSPPAESAISFTSPSENLINDKRSWQHWLDVVRRVEIDGTPVAFVFDGERADGASGEAVVPVACDPATLMLTRVTSPGTVEHVIWEDRDVLLPNSTACTPYPSMVIRGITITEEF